MYEIDLEGRQSAFMAEFLLPRNILANITGIFFSNQVLFLAVENLQLLSVEMVELLQLSSQFERDATNKRVSSDQVGFKIYQLNHDAPNQNSIVTEKVFQIRQEAATYIVCVDSTGLISIFDAETRQLVKKSYP